MEAPFKDKVFITGITGFTGRYIEKLFFKSGFDVYGSSFTESDSVKHFKCDILNENELSDVLNLVRPNYIIHLAAVSFVGSSNALNMYNVNVFGTLNLLNAIKNLDYEVEKVLIASSAAVYGNKEGALNESMCPKPVNHYGNSKLVMENMVESFFGTLNIVITRPFNYSGLGQEAHFLIPKIVSHFRRKEKVIELGNLNVFREFNSVHLVVRLYMDLLLSNVRSEIVNVCSGEIYNINEILNIMNSMAGYEINVRVNPDFVRKNEIKKLMGEPKKLKSLLSYPNASNDLPGMLSEMYRG